MLSSKKLSLHRGKLRLVTTNSFGAQVVITGLWIDRGHPRLSASERNSIRSLFHKAKIESNLNGKTSQSFHDAHNSVSGKVALMSRLGHNQAINFRQVLSEIQPEYSLKSSKKIEKLCYKFYGKKGAAKSKPPIRDAFTDLCITVQSLVVLTKPCQPNCVLY